MHLYCLEDWKNSSIICPQSCKTAVQQTVFTFTEGPASEKAHKVKTLVVETLSSDTRYLQLLTYELHGPVWQPRASQPGLILLTVSVALSTRPD